jgi:hypothetical protein
LKTSGENYKAKMEDLEKISADEFYAKTHQH